MKVSRKSIAAGNAKHAEKRKNLIESLWGEDYLNENKLWNRKAHDGWTTLPRTMPQIHKIMDKFSGKGTPLSGTNLALWCNVHDEAFLEIKDKERYAFESGFSGSRAVTTWLSRMRKLEELGFICSKSGAHGDFSFVLLINPLNVVKNLYKDIEKDNLYNALVARMNDVGANFE